MDNKICYICGHSSTDDNIIKPCDCADHNDYPYYVHRYCFAAQVFNAKASIIKCDICQATIFSKSYGYTTQCDDVRCKTLKYFIKMMLMCIITSMLYIYLFYVIRPDTSLIIIGTSCILPIVLVILLYIIVGFTFIIPYVNITKKWMFYPIVHIGWINIDIKMIYYRLIGWSNPTVQLYRKYNPSAHQIISYDASLDKIFPELYSIYQANKYVACVLFLLLIPFVLVYLLIKILGWSYIKYYSNVIKICQLSTVIILDQTDPNQYMIYI